MKLIPVGVDLAKNVSQMHGVDRSGKTVWPRKLFRGLTCSSMPSSFLNAEIENENPTAAGKPTEERYVGSKAQHTSHSRRHSSTPKN